MGRGLPGAPEWNLGNAVMAPKTVRVPAAMEPVFEAADNAVAEYFAGFDADPSKGTIEISGERYVLIRAAALSVQFFSLVERLFGEGRQSDAQELARNLLFDLAHAIGESDARSFQERMQFKDPIERLSAGPVHFSHTGWAFVDILAESQPAPNDDYYLLYDHPYSFEAAAWLRSGREAEFPVCIMSAGYSSGWCEESFGVTLVASEILCRAKGDECCRFIMAPPHRIEAHIRRYMHEKPQLASRIRADNIPDFFARKQAEEDLAKTLADLERFNSLAVGRELRMIELKREVNKMAGKAGLEPPYDLAFAEAGTADGDKGVATQ